MAESVDRLRPQLKSLLAAQILKTITGSDVTTASRTPSLNVTTQIIPVTGQALGGARAQRFKANTEIKLELVNHENQNLYVAAISVNSDGSLSFLYPTSGVEEDAALLKPEQPASSAAITLSPCWLCGNFDDRQC